MVSLYIGCCQSSSDTCLEYRQNIMGRVAALKQPNGNLTIRKAQRALNVIGICYYLGVTVPGVLLEWFIILPELSRVLDLSVASHRMFMMFMFVNAMGNYVLAATRTACFKKKKQRNSSRKPSHMWIPLRAHYCKVCEQYILKRDHHCFIIGKCIGYHNQKHFIYCSLYTALVSVYALITASLYMHMSFQTKFVGAFSFFTLLPSSVELWLRGVVGTPELLLVLFLYVCLIGMVAGLGLFTWQMFIVVMGLTTHEALKGVKGTQTTIWENLSDTFGKCWLLGVLFPLPLPQYGTGMYEDEVKLIDIHRD